jgi:hypothetical protein
LTYTYIHTYYAYFIIYALHNHIQRGERERGGEGEGGERDRGERRERRGGKRERGESGKRQRVTGSESIGIGIRAHTDTNAHQIPCPDLSFGDGCLCLSPSVPSLSQRWLPCSREGFHSHRS